MTMLCATVMEPTVERALDAIRGVADRVDLVEVRLDALASGDPAAIVAGSPAPLLFTCRSAVNGGGFSGSEAARRDILRAAIDAGAAWVDVELDAASDFAGRGDTKLIVSHHDFERTPDDLPALARRLADAGGDIAKLVTAAHRDSDVVRVMECLAGSETPLAAHTMGPVGFPGRILAARFGSEIIYGAARSEAAGARGQPTIRTLIGDFGMDRDLAGAAVILLIGQPLSHSVSPRMLNRAFRREGIDALYVPWETDDPEAVLGAMATLGVAGAAVTIPHKETVLRLLGSLHASAGATLAVNTITVREGVLEGRNADLGGALDAIRSVMPELDGMRALLVGAGGAARAIGRGLNDAGVTVRISNRTEARAERLAGDIGATAVDLADLDRGDLDLIVNATPVGQWPNEDVSPVPKDLLRPRQVVFDAVYNPLETRLLADAREAGARVVPGIGMLARQAARQVRAWFGREIDPATLEAEGRRALRLRRDPVVLVGMRGAGKTTVGRIVAERLGREFVDLDDRIEERAKKTIPEIFTESGEGYFRTVERQSFFRAAEQPAIVLATGGGLTESRVVRGAMRQGGMAVIYLSAPAVVLAERIAGSDRPSLTGARPEDEAGDVLRAREGHYREVATSEVDAASGSADVVAERVLDALFL